MRSEIRAFVTGATGFLGSHFLLWLAREREARTFLLVRGEGPDACDSKVRSSLARAAGGYPDLDWRRAHQRIADLLVGDVQLPQCGLSKADITQLRRSGIDEFWHYAASLAFEEHRRDVISGANVDGARHAVSLAVEIGAKRFFYCSTAYSAGRATGSVPEVLHSRSRPFSNVYEETKCQAEHVVADLCARHGMALTILRPSIVIGCSDLARTGGSTTGLYGFIDKLAQLVRHIEPECILRIRGEPSTEVNFVPVDWLMTDLAQVVAWKPKPLSIAHLCVDHGLRADYVMSTIGKCVGLKDLIVTETTPEHLSAAEQLLDAHAVFYRSYISQSKRFERRLARSWVLTEGDFARFVVNGLDEIRRGNRRSGASHRLPSNRPHEPPTRPSPASLQK